MSRLPIFVLLGPLLSWLILIAMLSPRLLTGPMFDEGWRMFFASLFGSYGITFLPLVAIAYIDRRLAHHRWRILACTVVGVGWTIALFYSITEGVVEKEHLHHWFLVALVGGLPAAVCSWLSGRYATDR